ncbi:MAG: ABC transporter permease [Candidatus Magnetoglobus multicellularis str. Araruama]|uniref:ABC transporter permease n=1 Tax=Candidatus Magnetoglobus multicellularis str. Araruama TaxID=890399 RepID=A0A1V1P7V7_9BACT|nr:MAG: ABC transporter permease [Candidatus Magnetoglobus multicellularis str. Araruama]
MHKYIAKKIPGGVKIAVCISLSMIAFATRTPFFLAALFFCNIVVIIMFQAPLFLILKECRFFLVQTVIIIVLYILKFGWPSGFLPGLTLSIQFVFFLLPGLILSHSVSPAQTARCFSVILPHYLAFVLSVCIHFIHNLMEEVNEIYEAQIMRGARITVKELCNPANWKDVVNCLIIPTIIYGFMMARQISMAAKARKFQIDEKRTCWNGE